MPIGETTPTIAELKGNTILELFKSGYNALKNALTRKQNKLIAGDNIVINEETNRISAIVGGEPVLDDYYTKAETNNLLNEKADIDDVYDKTAVDNLLSEKENLISAGTNITIVTDIDDKKTIKLSNDINREGTTNLTGATNIVGNTNITGNVTVNGNITQNGESYETHAEKIYTENDYIVTRDGAEGALASGDYSGIEVEKYDGTNNCRLVVDNEGVARVGDVADEQPLLTRDESGNLTDGESLVWDATNLKAKTVSIPSDIVTALAGKQDNISVVHAQFTNLGGISNGGGYIYKFGKICWATIDLTPTGSGVVVSLGFPAGYRPVRTFYAMIGNYVTGGYGLAYYNGTNISFTTPNANGQCAIFAYITDE